VSLNIGKIALSNNQIALDLVGKNIANANDPAYARQRLHITSTVAGNVVNRIEQAVDESLQKDMIREQGQLSYYSKQADILKQIESSINELTDSDLSSSLDNFYSSLEQLSLDPQDLSLRETVMQSAQQVTDTFHLVGNSFLQLSQRVDQEIGDHADVINHLLERIASLNVEVAQREGGVNDSPAVDIRDKRRELLDELSKMMNITTSEMSNGAVLVQSEGRTLVFQNESRGVYIDNNDGTTRLRYSSDNSYVEPKGGSLGGLLSARKDIINPRNAELNQLAAEFAWQMNLVHNTGRGLNGLTSVTSNTRIQPNYIDKPLNLAKVDAYSLGQQFLPQNGTLTLQMRNDVSGDMEESNIDITLVGDKQMSLQDLADQLNQIEHMTASIDNFGHLSLKSESGFSFFIEEDTSKVSAFLGFNNLFTGNDALTLKLNEDIVNDVSKFAAAKSNSAGDNTNLISLIQTKQNKLSNGQTLSQHYESYVSKIAALTNRITSLSDNQERILSDVTDRRNAFSGVNLDEEAANLLRYQQTYQAAAQYISVQNQLISILFQAI
jgi:flagellar hook-associated protein 1